MLAEFSLWICVNHCCHQSLEGPTIFTIASCSPLIDYFCSFTLTALSSFFLFASFPLSLLLPLPAEAPRHILSGPPATPHRHQPHRPLPPSERRANAQTFPGATHDSDHALGAALPLQSMRPRPTLEGPSCSSTHRVHHPHTPFTASSSPVLDPASKREESAPPHRCVGNRKRAH